MARMRTKGIVKIYEFISPMNINVGELMSPILSRATKYATRHSQEGFSLIELIMSLGLSAVIGVMLMAFFNNLMSSATGLNDVMDKDEVRSFLQRKVDCAETIKTKNPLSDSVTLRNVKGQDVGGQKISGTGTGFDGSSQINGLYYAKAFYRGEDAGIEIQVAKKISGNVMAFARNPITKTPEDFSFGAAQPLIGGASTAYRLCSGRSPAGLQMAREITDMATIKLIPGVYGPMAEMSCHNVTTGELAYEQYPLQINDACRLYCIRKNYTTGYMLGCQNFVDGVSQTFPASQRWSQDVWCSCVK